MKGLKKVLTALFATLAVGMMALGTSCAALGDVNLQDKFGDIGKLFVVDSGSDNDDVSSKDSTQEEKPSDEENEKPDEKPDDGKEDDGENESEYEVCTIAEARTAEKGAKVQVEGVVAQITYANGRVPCGVILVDDTQSIYVYDGNIAGKVKIGNKITVAASKTYWILEKEQTAAQKHGYKGCNQLENATLVANDNGKHEYNKEWIADSTIKTMLETPVSEDVTTIIYKVNALVKKVPGNGFTNYYFFDLDGETGEYTYSQCNGSDFAWIDAFDGKICTVYLTMLNAKSNDSACFFRFQPVEIIDENFVFNTNDAAQFAVDYYGLDQFEETYYADPALELQTAVSSELLGFAGATLSYQSDNESTVYFEETDGKVVMHCGAKGEANVTVTGAYNGKTFEKTVKICVEVADSYNSITVAQAIAAEVDSEVTVKGIVGPSVVNKDGFYLFGEDGSMIATLLSNVADFASLSVGDEVILTGMRERYVKDDASAIAGQTCIVNATILVNNYGNHAYSTEKFVKDKTLADFYALDKTVDYSTTVFVLKAKVNYVETSYYTKWELTWTDGNGKTTKASLYMKSAGQYSILDNFKGKEVTMEIAPCNWNDKNFWAGCILAIYTEDGKVLNELNFLVNA